MAQHSPLSSCIACSGATRAGLAPWHAVCPACSYERADLQPTINQRAAHAQLDERDRETGLKALRQENFRTIVAYAADYAPPGATSLLEVGCAHGWFLEVARERFDVLGVEPDEAVGSVTLAGGLPVRQGYFPDALQPGERFDVIVFNDVIEHIPDIRAAVAACHARLTDRGILVLNLPSSTGFFYRLSKLFAGLGWRGPFERLWQKDLPSPHVHYFNAENLAGFVRQHGFDLVKSAELPSLRASGLLERMRCVGKTHPVALYLQYVLILAALPVLRLFPSDIVVGVFRKR
jgi:2-polyprenyl-3-methyl-5-hydroxy-6-metoxy-1,4-benzoquinol methylase